MTREERSAHWRGVVERWSISGVSVAQFCQENGIPAWKFMYWRKRLGAPLPSHAPGFAVVEAVGAGSGVCLRLASGLELAIEPGFDAVTLRRVLACLAP